MSPCIHDFTALRPSQVAKVWLADNSAVPVVGEGEVYVKGAAGTVCIRNVLYVPSLSMPLLSVPAVFDHGGKVQFHHDVVELFSTTSASAALVGQRSGNGWHLKDLKLASTSQVSEMAVRVPDGMCLSCKGASACCDGCLAAVRGADPNKSSATWELWHARLGHVGLGQLARIFSDSLVSGAQVTGQKPKTLDCDACLEGKMHRHPFSASSSKSSAAFELLHTDLMGPVQTLSCKHNKYILVIIDDHTRYAWVYFLKKKNHAAERLREFFALVERQHAAKVKRLRSDRGGEFLSIALGSWMEAQGIVHELSIPNTPQQNGVAECHGS